ncbi:TPR repeat region [Oesophagostomum dentatum]|uniref:TPR repeat region n=1 Tax=Oesophagostomum dentatum TaxID=61180 RepID=A0A0B1SSD6_OESDE|nr:TPR repeat region [Oesophagostomum dentatum]
MFRLSVSRVVSLVSAKPRISLPRSLFSSPAAMSKANVEDLDLLRARLHYQSKKRGILENDLLIGAFADRYLPKMNREQLESYDKSFCQSLGMLKAMHPFMYN